MDAYYTCELQFLFKSGPKVAPWMIHKHVFYLRY